jgi:hypothetical protein
MGVFIAFMSVIKLNGYFLNIGKCIGREWGGRLQLHRYNGEFVVSNGFGGLGVLDERTKWLLDLYIPLSKIIQIYRGDNHNIEIKIFFS